MPSDPTTRTPRRPGGLVVISGPSGAGKTSICNALLERLPGSVWSISVTTRPKRHDEVDGSNYRFVSREQFDAMRQRGEFLETAEYVGNLYGTPHEPVNDAVADGKPIVLEIDVQGGIQVARKMPDSIRIFVIPPTPESLQARLKGRETESEEQLGRRLAKADGEIAVARDSGCYKHFVINDVLEETVDHVVDIIQTELNAK